MTELAEVEGGRGGPVCQSERERRVLQRGERREREREKSDRRRWQRKRVSGGRVGLSLLRFCLDFAILIVLPLEREHTGFKIVFGLTRWRHAN